MMVLLRCLCRLLPLCSFLMMNQAVWGQEKVTDTIAADVEVPVRDSLSKAAVYQLRVGLDISRFLFNNLYPSRKGYEIQMDYHWRNNLYWAAEGGWGRGKVDYPFLKYKTRGGFVRLGIEQSLLGSIGVEDFDNAFIGVRYAMGFGRMGDAYFTVPTPFGGVSEGTAEGWGYWVHWGEITGGMKVELWPRFYAGWMVRGKFLLNPGTFKDIAPNYIPGFGKGDKNTTFDFNFYLSYGLRWH